LPGRGSVAPPLRFLSGNADVRTLLQISLVKARIGETKKTKRALRSGSKGGKVLAVFAILALFASFLLPSVSLWFTGQVR